MGLVAESQRVTWCQRSQVGDLVAVAKVTGGWPCSGGGGAKVTEGDLVTKVSLVAGGKGHIVVGAKVTVG